MKLQTLLDAERTFERVAHRLTGLVDTKTKMDLDVASHALSELRVFRQALADAEAQDEASNGMTAADIRAQATTRITRFLLV